MTTTTTIETNFYDDDEQEYTVIGTVTEGGSYQPCEYGGRDVLQYEPDDNTKVESITDEDGLEIIGTSREPIFYAIAKKRIEEKFMY